MNITTEKVQKITSKGQITLPILWRNKFKTNQILLKARGKMIEITPVEIESLKNPEYTVFDAIRDNKGKGIKVADLLKILKKIG
ncbi:MAG: hypothetical protein ABIJ28_01550 [Patescibacteria group bacterium]